MNIASRNLVILSGPLVSEPKLSELKHGKMLRFRINTPESRKKKDGERYIHDEYHNIVVYSQALIKRFMDAAPKLGDIITVEGSITSREYMLDGAKRYITEIVANERRGDLRVERTEKIFETDEKDVDTKETPVI